MREIKFRAISMCNGEHWLYGDLRHYNKNPHTEKWVIHDPNTGIETDIDETTIGQFVGLKDKNGKEIYEGDIVCITDNEKDVSSNSEVKFRNGVFGIENWTKKHLTTLNFFILDSNNDEQEYSVEVVGNIYDNPDIQLRYDDRFNDRKY